MPEPRLASRPVSSSWRERRRILRAVKHDELLRDPDDAQALVEIAGRNRLRQRRPGLLHLLGALGVLALGLLPVVADAGRTPLLITVALAIGVIGSEAWKYVDRRRSSERWDRAEARHVEYLEELGLDAWRRPAD